MLNRPSSIRTETYPFRHLVLEGLVTENQVLELAEPILAAQGTCGWVHYGNDEELKLASRDVVGQVAPVARLFSELLSEWFCRELAYLLGLQVEGLRPDNTLHGGGVHVSHPGGYLAPHLDYALHPHLSPPMERRMNLILHLSPEWREEWGGATELLEADGETVAARVFPRPGRALVWEPSDLSYHGTQRIVRQQEGEPASVPPPRITAAVYYVAPARPSAVRRRALFVPQRQKHGA